MTARLCGIDIGTTNLKVVLMDETGGCLWSRAIPTPRVDFRGGVATDAEHLLDAVETLMIDGWREAGGGRALDAIAATGVGEDGVGLDAQLRPTGPALPWFDGRAGREAVELARHPAADGRIGLAIGPDRTLAKWLWLRRNAPDMLARAASWVALTDYPAVRWTGVPFMSRTLAARTAAYDVFAREWVGELLEASGAPPLPPVHDAGTVVGTVAGGALRASGAADARTLVVAGGHDHPVAAAAIRRSAPSARIDSLGTANVVYGETERALEPRLHPPLALSVPVMRGAGLACLGVFELAAHLAPDARARAELDCALASPRLPGPPLGGGPLRRQLEEASLAARRMFDTMDALGVPADQVYATGGWSRSRAFMELRASVLGAPLHVVDEPELAALGAALLAADGAGTRTGFDARARLTTIEPLPEWAEAYAAWADTGATPNRSRPLKAAHRQEEFMTLFNLTGQIAFVTGAGSGIGRSIATGLAEAGADVACFGRRHKRAALEETAQAIAAKGRRALVVEGDVTVKADLDAAIARVERELGPLDIAVNNAGVANAEPAETLSLDQWNALYAVNATGVFLSCQAEGAVMLPRRRGAIINIASISGTIVNRGITQVHYNSSKAAVIQLSKSLAMEWSDRGIRVNVISPGYTFTPMNDRSEVADHLEVFRRDTPMQRIASSDEMIGPAVFLASKASSFVTGIDLIVDGGFVCW